MLIRNLFFFMVLGWVLLSPASAYASSDDDAKFFDTSSFTSILSYLHLDGENYQDYSSDKNDFSSYDNYKNDKNWWGSFWDWLCDYDKGDYHNGGDNNQCTDQKKWSWGNDDGCLDSAEIWKKWYCN
ncbi:hypothetical protein [Neobacillus mesonae]|uniref:hypothetical protein n=1 Tax=Neobacillus mesonae TaxID=1193713 RepID=UPI00203D2FE3|nr:hypothetical protein [Neobacillus mesonae]MCM3568195.1 hypothetical protein [Neobacillus mesonae]